MLKKIALLSLASISSFAMHSFEVNISDKDLGIYTQVDMGQFVNTIRPDTTYLGFSFLNADEDHSEGYNNKFKPFFELSFLKMKEISESDLSIGLGVKANYTAHYSALPLGAEIQYKLSNISNVVPLSVKASFYYAPEVLSLLDAREFLEIGCSVNIEVIQNGSIKLGYRRIETNFEYSTYRLNALYNESMYFGYKFAF